MKNDPIWRRYARLHGIDPRQDVDEEFEFHLAERIETLVAQGRSPMVARAEALARFGDIDRARRACAAIGARRSVRQRLASYLESWTQDVRYAARVFRRSPGFALAVVLTASLGIGANAIVFTMLDAVLLRPLAVARPNEIVRVYTSDASARQGGTKFGASSYPDYMDLRRAPALRALAAYAPVGTTLRRENMVTRVEGRFISENFFAMLGVQPALGRLISPADSASNTPIAVLSHKFWLSELGGDSAVVGATVDLNGKTTIVVGVAAPEFVGIEPSRIDAYIPMSANRSLSPGSDLATTRGDRSVRMIGRLSSGSTAARAAQDLNEIMRSLAASYPETNRDRVVSVRLAKSLIDPETSGAPAGPLTALLFGVTGLVLLIATANVAALLLARTLSRRRELAVRVSLGASRARILRQLMTESVLLAVIAELVALAAVASLPLLARAIGVPESLRFGVDARVLGFASAVTLLAALTFTLSPALRAVSNDAFTGLREAEGSARPARARAQRSMVVVQVALSIVLLVTAGLLMQSLRRQRQVNPGFETSHLLAAEFESVDASQTREQEFSLAEATLARARALPGVTVAAVAANPPLTSEGARTTITVPGYESASGENMDVPFAVAGSNYFAALGIPILRGEELRGDVEDTVSRAVINEAMARRFWPNKNPVGSTIRLGGSGGRSVQVIGVAADSRMRSLAESPTPRFVLQSRRGGGATLLIRSSGNPESLIPVVRRMLGEIHPSFALRRLRTMDDIVGASLLAAKTLATSIAIVSALAATLAVLGLYGVVSYLAAQRTREFGIRMALGADASDVLRLVLSSGLRLAVIGGVVGLVLSLASGAVLHGFLYSVSFADVSTLLAVSVLMALVAIGASALPALRATRTSPATTLRAE